MPRLLDDRETHALVQLDDGEVELIPWSPMNRLIYRQNLHDLLVEGTEILSTRNEQYAIELVPDDDASSYSLTVSDGEGDFTVSVPPNEKHALMEALVDGYEQDDRAGALVQFAYDVLDYTVPPDIVDPLSSVSIFEDAVEVTSDGWLIHDHVLLTYNNEFYHPNVRATQRNGKPLPEDANNVAYEVRFQKSPDVDGQSGLSDFAGFADVDDVADFVSRALWAVLYTPEEPPT